MQHETEKERKKAVMYKMRVHMYNEEFSYTCERSHEIH